jgi:hypothetical protein
MKNLFVVCASLLAAVIMTGCASTYTNDAANQSKVVIQPAKVQTVLNFDAEKKVEGKASANVLFGLISWGDSKFADRANLAAGGAAGLLPLPNPVESVKQAAVYNACAAADCDVIVGAKYEVDVMDYVVFKRIQCKVVGHPGAVSYK